MRTEVVDVSSAVGKLLCTPIFQASGKKLLAKGHQINEEDIRLLGLEGHERVPVAILDDNEIPEDQASSQIAAEAACGAMEIRLAAGGRANLFATENCSFLVDEDLLRHVNRSGNVTIATAPNFCFALAGQRVATVKTAPFAVERRNFEATLSLLTDKGPIIQGRPIGTPTVAVLYTDLRSGARGRQLFEGIMKTRLERFHTTASYALSCVEGKRKRWRGPWSTCCGRSRPSCWSPPPRLQPDPPMSLGERWSGWVAVLRTSSHRLSLATFCCSLTPRRFPWFPRQGVSGLRESMWWT